MPSDQRPDELSDDEHQQVERELARRRWLLVRGGILIALLLASLLLMGLPWWIVGGLSIVHATWWLFLTRHYRRTIEAAIAAGWRGWSDAQ